MHTFTSLPPQDIDEDDEACPEMLNPAFDKKKDDDKYIQKNLSEARLKVMQAKGIFSIRCSCTSMVGHSCSIVMP